MASSSFQAPRGTSDILPEDQPYWSYVWGTAASVAASFGYERIDTPIFEETALFSRGVGEETEVVEKQMYSFDDLGGDSITLKPDGTAPVCRAYIQRGMHNQPQPVRLFYQGPYFRYERPQAGRFRQFHQFGVEAIGDASAQVDAEVIELGWSWLASLGLTGLSLSINSIGDGVCRPGHLAKLVEYFSEREDGLCSDHKGRYRSNPLRVLDCKKAPCVSVSGGAPRSVDDLCDDCSDHWDELRRTLDLLVGEGALSGYEENARLVRGLDYYNRTVFEYEPAERKGQSTIGGGGRYDPLIEILGGPPTPGIGFAIGMERVLLNLKAQGVSVPGGPVIDIVCVHIGDAAHDRMLALASGLRATGRTVIVAPMGRGMRSQMRYANSKGARYALILGERDLENGVATLRSLKTDDDQTEVSLDPAVIAEASR
ncbi:MAG: histidine--tRNA ligase [Chloroflexi bacterium]|nr:histidine--tRNA ligase [Chloroflexota bacterium]